MNLETYIREKKAKGYYAFGVYITRINSNDVRIDIAPMVAGSYVMDELAELVVKEDTITMDGAVHDQVRRLLKESKEGLDMAKLNHSVQNFHEHHDEYLDRIINELYSRMQLKGMDSVKEYLQKMEIVLIPGGEFKFDL